MLYISKIDDYLKILTDEEEKDFLAINFSEYFKSAKEKLYSKLNKEQNLRKVTKLLNIFLTTIDEVENRLKWCTQILLITVLIAVKYDFKTLWSRVTTD